MSKTTKPSRAAATPVQDVVRQSELQAVVDMHSAIQTACFNIRRRLEAGAVLECGRFGVTTFGQESLEEFVGEGWTLDRWAKAKYTSVCGHTMEIQLAKKLQDEAGCARGWVGDVPAHQFVLGAPMKPFGPAHSVKEFQSILKKAAFQKYTHSAAA